MYLTIDEVNEFNECNYIEERYENKYLVFEFTDENKKVFKNYAELWNRIKNDIETINNGKAGEYGKELMKIKFSSDDNFPFS